MTFSLYDTFQSPRVSYYPGGSVPEAGGAIFAELLKVTKPILSTFTYTVQSWCSTDAYTLAATPSGKS